MKYTLMKGRDARDNVVALWLRRTDAKTNECAYLGKCPPAGERGKHAARIKQITLAKPDLYVFEDGSMFSRHCDYSSATLIATWETA
ncbi:MAG: hypothetical protein ACRCYS_18930 [Beijerinckiaceae bacterium]